MQSRCFYADVTSKAHHRHRACVAFGDPLSDFWRDTPLLCVVHVKP
jgi:hypothetical protein